MTDGRVRIEPLGTEHQDRFLAGVERSRELHRGFVTPPPTPDEYAAYLGRFDGNTGYGFAIVRVADSGLAGAAAINEVVRGRFWSAYLGYQAFAPLNGKGLMREGLGLVLDEAFDGLGLHRVEANIQPDNAASLALVARLGFRKEGYSPKYLKVDQEWRDHERWALLADEWTRFRAR